MAQIIYNVTISFLTIEKQINLITEFRYSAVRHVTAYQSVHMAVHTLSRPTEWVGGDIGN